VQNQHYSAVKDELTAWSVPEFIQKEGKKEKKKVTIYKLLGFQHLAYTTLMTVESITIPFFYKLEGYYYTVFKPRYQFCQLGE